MANDKIDLKQMLDTILEMREEFRNEFYKLKEQTVTEIQQWMVHKVPEDEPLNKKWGERWINKYNERRNEYPNTRIIRLERIYIKTRMSKQNR